MNPRKPLKVAGIAAALVIAVLLVGGGAILLEQRILGGLQIAQADVDLLKHEIGARDAETRLLRERTNELQAEIDALERELEERTVEVAEGQQLVAQLQGALGQSGDLSSRFAQLTDDYAALQADHRRLTSELSRLEQRMTSLIPIRTPELSGDALYLDRSVSGVVWTAAICSGSMEPNITCSDLLVLAEPRVTDLQAGDIIYFRKPLADCSGPSDRFMLHRIRRLVLRPDGLYFETKGDNLPSTDACLVPERDVMYKLVTNVRNARINE